MESQPEFEIVPGVKWEPLFKPEQEYEAFRQWWQEHVDPELRKQDEARDRSFNDLLHCQPFELAA